MLEGSYGAARGIDEPAPGTLRDVGGRREANRWNFLPTRAHSALKNSTTQVVGTASWEERVSGADVLPEVCIAATHFGEAPLGIGKANGGAHGGIGRRGVIHLYAIDGEALVE